MEIVGFDPTLSGVQREVAEHVALAYATCPRCGQRDPATVEELRKDRRNIAILTYGVMLGIAVGSYFVPWIAIGFFALMLVPFLVELVRRPRARLVVHVGFSLGWLVLACMFSRYAFVLPAVAIIQLVLKRSDPEEADRPFREGAAKLRFL